MGLKPKEAIAPVRWEHYQRISVPVRIIERLGTAVVASLLKRTCDKEVTILTKYQWLEGPLVGMEPDFMSKDPLGEAQKKIGKSWKEFTQIDRLTAMMKSASINGAKTEFNKLRGDTYWGMGWENFKTLMLSKGFEIVLTDKFHHWGEPENIEEFVIMAHKAGLLVTADSFGLTSHPESDLPVSVNSGTLYGQAMPTTSKGYFTTSCTSGYEEDSNGNRVWTFQLDIREHLFADLTKIASEGDLLPIWTVRNSWGFRLQDYGYEHGAGHGVWKEHKEKQTADRLSRLPDWVRQMVATGVEV